MLHRREVVLELCQKFGVRTTLKHLGQERSARIEDFASEGGGAFHQTDDAQLIRLAMPGGVGCHVRHHHIRAATDHSTQLLGCAIVEKIHLRECHARQFRHIQ